MSQTTKEPLRSLLLHWHSIPHSREWKLSAPRPRDLEVQYQEKSREYKYLAKPLRSHPLKTIRHSYSVFPAKAMPMSAISIAGCLVLQQPTRARSDGFSLWSSEWFRPQSADLYIAVTQNLPVAADYRYHLVRTLEAGSHTANLTTNLDDSMKLRRRSKISHYVSSKKERVDQAGTTRRWVYRLPLRQSSAWNGSEPRDYSFA